MNHVETARAKFDCRIAFAEELVALARDDERIVAVCNDSVGSSNLGAFQKEFQNRLVNVGIAEQNMVGVAAGLSNGGHVPFVCAASPFLTGRALEQIKADVAYSGRHVVLCGMSPGLAYGQLGPTHHSIEDLAWLRAISGLTIIVPADPRQTREAVRWALGADRPVFLRVSRHAVPSVTPEEWDSQLDQAIELRAGNDVALLTTGIMVQPALDAAEILQRSGIQARVVDFATVTPLDAEAVIRAARETGGIVTIEEATRVGGFGSAVAETVVQNCPVPMRILGVPGFAPTGDVTFLLEHFHLNAEGIAEAARTMRG
jgi:transketolase